MSDYNNFDQITAMSAAIAALSMDAVERAQSGHPGMPMGMATVATTLFTQQLKFDAAAPDWPDRDRFILSAGHGSMLLYSLAYLLGYPGMEMDDLKNFRQLGAKTAGHPEYGHAPAVETTTGPLGQGLANAVGMAIAEAHLRATYGAELVDHNTYCIVGDGCLMEGISQEAISLAGQLNLHKLTLLWDDNEITIDGPVSRSDHTDQLARFAAAGWDVVRIDGHDPQAIVAALTKATKTNRPSLIACRTIIGKGADKKAGTSAAHGAPLGAEEIAAARRNLHWDYPPFEIPEHILTPWRQAGVKGQGARKEWQARLEASNKKTIFDKAMSGDYKSEIQQAIRELKQTFQTNPQKMATRKASQMALEVLNPAISSTLGGSADLTGSNNTRTARLETLDTDNYAGRYLYYGIREHGMAAAMNGMALHGGVIPYGGTFLVFADYCRPAIRLSALMRQRVIYVMTHDSIGLGEDGPTHQPVEHLASLRAIPNLYVFRPADTVETAECWQAALLLRSAPSILALSRQGLPQLRLSAEDDNLCQRGAYILADQSDYQISLFASGSELSLAMDAAARLAGQGIKARIISVPCLELFAEQDMAYQQEVLGTKPRLVIEAALQQGWNSILCADGQKGDFLGMTGFGASAPAAELYKHFGITAQEAVSRVMKLLS